MKSIYVYLVFVLLSKAIQAQPDNIFWDRAFWESQPTIEVIEQKISEGHSASALNPFGFDAVVASILAESPIEVIKHLLSKKGNNINKLTHDKRTYVFWAAYKNNADLMKHLIAKGARMDLRDSHHFSVLTFAAATGNTNTEVYNLCIERGINVETDKDEHGANALLLISPFLKDEELIDYFTSKGLSISDKDNDGNGIFNYAARKGNKELIDLLIKKGADYKGLNKHGGNAFMFAAEGTRNHTNTLETYTYLEQLGIEPNIITDNGFTPLHALAHKNKDIDIFSYFINKGVDVNMKDINGNTAFINASYRNNLKTISFLSRHIKDINGQNKKGLSPLMCAVENNTTDVVAFLLDKGAHINAKDKTGNTLVTFLIKSFSDTTQKEFNNKFQLLRNMGLDFTELQSNEENLWHVAVKQNNLNLLEKLTQFDVSINHKNKDGYTPLHVAAMKAKDTKILKFLIAHGADKSFRTEFNETPLDLAKENELLVNKGALNFLQ